MHTGLLLVLAELGEEEGDAGDEEDDEDPQAVDQHGLAVLGPVALVAPDRLLQVSHERGCPRQHQDGGPEVLVHHQHPRLHRGGHDAVTSPRPRPRRVQSATHALVQTFICVFSTFEP